MSDIAIRVEHLSKLYRIGSAGRPRYETLYDKIAGAGGRLWKRVRRPFAPQSESETRNSNSEFIWALKDVSFEVKRGEVVGIIGRNGAGKSTLLKILSRITEPTEGRAEVYGRVGSLLEVGTGFHPELTGRENIYLNGAILGMKKAEIDRKFDEIVAFAEIEKFIDTPVKFYSSGMYVRLAFAVAAHLDPEILLVDEVLAVGDAAFQKKCLGKMGEVAEGGRTVLFVSHNMAAMQQLCRICIWVEQGEVLRQGLTSEIIGAYTQSIYKTTKSTASWNRYGSGAARFESVILTNFKGEETHLFSMGEPLIVNMKVKSEKKVLQVAVIINDSQGQTLIHAIGEDDGFIARSSNGCFKFRAIFPKLTLYPGDYTIGVYCGYMNEDYDYIPFCSEFSVVPGAISRRTTPFRQGKAVFFSETIWENLE